MLDEELTIDCSPQPRKRTANPKAAPTPPLSARRAPVALTARPAPPPDEWDSHGRVGEMGSAEYLREKLMRKLNEALVFATREPLPFETRSWRWTKVSLLARRCQSIADALEEKASIP